MLKKFGGFFLLIFSVVGITYSITGFYAKLFMDSSYYELGNLFMMLILGIGSLYFGPFLLDNTRMKKITGIVLAISGGIIILLLWDYIFNGIKPGEQGYNNQVLVIVFQLITGLVILITGILLVKKQKKDFNKE